MTESIGLIYAHPDDETFTSACLIRQAADLGKKTVLLTATWGEAGKSGRLGAMTKEELAVKREQELHEAGRIMGLSEIENLGFPDGSLDSVDRNLLVDHIVQFLQKHQISIVVTFPEDGISGHRDHIVIHHAVKEAVYSGCCPSVQKLYFKAARDFIESGKIPTLTIDSENYWDMKACALRAHESQILSIERVFGKEIAYQKDSIHKDETYILAWERGKDYPQKIEQSIYDDLV